MNATRTADPIGTDANRVDWTIPAPHGLDRLPDDACGRCGGLGVRWLSQKYRCRECSGSGMACVPAIAA